jgi:hypothetical protein
MIWYLVLKPHPSIWTIGPCDAQVSKSVRDLEYPNIWNNSRATTQVRCQHDDDDRHTLGSDVQLLGFRYDTHFANQFQTTGNEYDGSYECHHKDPFESAEGYREFKTLCWIERDRSRR